MVYRFIFASYLLKDSNEVLSCMERPWSLREKASGKTFYEPFAGGGTGLAEAAMAGWNVYGSEINPIATEVASAELQIVCNGIPKEYFLQICKILDIALERLRDCWYIYDGVISYTLISRGEVPTWVSSIRRGGKKYKVILCPSCKSLFLYQGNSNNSRIHCKVCEEEITVSIKPIVPLQENLPEVAPGWRAFLIEYRRKNGKKRWEKQWVNLLIDKEGRNLLTKSVRKAHSLLKEYREHLKLLEHVTFNNLFEGRRLHREGGFRNLANLFTSKQLVASILFSKLCSEKLNKKYWTLAKIALSDSAKTTNLLAKWYPITGEPVPATAMKTYWVPTYTAETNPLAHVPETLTPLARNTIASAVRAQQRAYKYIKGHGGNHKVKWRLYNISAEKVSLPERIDLAVVDPPYTDESRWRYTSLSLVHYAQFILFNSIVGQKLPPLPQSIEVQEITYNKKRYFEVLSKVLRHISMKLATNGRVIFMFNTTKEKLWSALLKVMREANLYPTAIYWTLGEVPGGLARSKLRGLFLIVLARGHINQKPYIVFKEPLEKANNFMRISHEVENKAYQRLLRALNRYYY